MNDEEIKELLKRNFELTRENNKLLKKIRRNGLIGTIFRFVWWGVIIGIPVFIYYYILQPYLVELSTAYQGVQSGVSGAQNALFDLPLISNLIEYFADKK